MADNVSFQTTPATPASGTVVAADEVAYSGETTKVQIVELAGIGGSEGSRTIERIGGDAANGLDVDVTRVTGTVTIAGTVTANAGSGTLATSDTATQVDDAAFTPGTGRVLMMGATLDDTSPDTVNEGDGGAVRMSADRALHVSIRDSAGNNRGLNVDANNRIGVTGLVQGSVAHDSAATDNPLIIGGVAESTRPAAVADGDAVRAWLDTAGRLVVSIGSPQTVYVAAEYTSNQTDASVIAAPGAGLQLVIFDITVSTGAAGTVLFEDGTATRLFGRLTLAANGGWQFNSPTGVRLTANQALTITTTTGAGPLAVTVNYAILPSL